MTLCVCILFVLCVGAVLSQQAGCQSSDVKHRREKSLEPCWRRLARVRVCMCCSAAAAADFQKKGTLDSSHPIFGIDPRVAMLHSSHQHRYLDHHCRRGFLYHDMWAYSGINRRDGCHSSHILSDLRLAVSKGGQEPIRIVIH